MTRPYRKKERAERQNKTRQRIVDAAVALHQTKGPRATTMADIAQEAGVGRVTVYRHFPDEAALAQACSGQYFERNQPPDPASWAAIPAPVARLRHGLRETYAYHRQTEAMMTHILAEARDHAVMAPYHAHWRRAAKTLAAAFPARGRAKRSLESAFAVALSFDTWRTLARDRNLDDHQAVEVMLRLACDCPEP